MDRQRMETLAQTLKNTGLAASATEAVRMAQNIIKTENRVSNDFDKKKDVIDKQDENQYKDSKEEILDLIEKTSFENKKNFFVPIKGYSPEQKQEIIEKKEEVKEVEINHTQRQEEIPQKLVVVDIPEEVNQKIEDLPAEKEETQPITEVKDKEEVHTESLSQPSPNIGVELPDDISLKELMDESAEEVYGNPQKEESPVVVEEQPQKLNVSIPELEIETLEEEEPIDNSEFGDINVQESSSETLENVNNEIPVYNINPIQEEEEINHEEPIHIDDIPQNETLEKIEDFPVEEINQTQVKQEDDFIMDINEMESSEPVQPISQEPESIPETIEEQSTPETEEVQEEKRVFANPIEKIDLSSFFKFG